MLEGGFKKENQRQHEGEMNAALNDVRVRSTPCGVKLEDDQGEGKYLDHLIPEASQFPHGNTSFRVKWKMNNS
jgi:hypothetical protein